MKCLAYIWFLLLSTAAIHGQETPEVRSEIRAFKKEMARLEDEYQKAVLKARADLTLKLSEMAKEFSDAGATEKAKTVEVAIKDIQNSNSIEKRLDLRKDISGRQYKFDERQWIYRFDADGFLYVPNQGNKRFPWVAVSDREVLYMNELGICALLLFNDDRTKFNMRILSSAKSNPKSAATRMR